MRLHLSALKVHLAHFAATGSGRYIGLLFTPSGIPTMATVPQAS
jgi:hypothetical protein